MGALPPFKTDVKMLLPSLGRGHILLATIQIIILLWSTVLLPPYLKSFSSAYEMDCLFLPKGALYFMLGNLDPAFRSRLEAINLVALFKSDLLRRYTLDDILKPFIDELKTLHTVSVHFCCLCLIASVLCIQTGLSLTVGNKQYCFTGTLIAFVGDTPALSMIGGFKEGVSFAMRKCRHCMATDSQIQTKVNVIA